MQYISVKNWDSKQHYKHRNPPWIKLHCDLLNDYEFARLKDACKSHLMLIWLLASRLDNKIPNDPKWIAKRIGSTTKIDVNVLIDKGFLEGERRKVSKRSVSVDSLFWAVIVFILLSSCTMFYLGKQSEKIGDLESVVFKKESLDLIGTKE